MSPNGLRRWRRYAKKCRYRSRKEGTRATGATAHGATARALFWKARNHPNFALPPKPFTPRSLVGMSQKARKRLRHDRLFGPNVAPTKLLLADSLTVQLHIGERLRPCSGCPQCTNDPLRILRALSRRMQLRLEIRRCNSSIIPSKFDYLAMLHRPGPAWNPVCGFGAMRQDSIRALCDVILREGAEEFPIVSCDGSGVLPARKEKP